MTYKTVLVHCDAGKSTPKCLEAPEEVGSGRALAQYGQTLCQFTGRTSDRRIEVADEG